MKCLKIAALLLAVAGLTGLACAKTAKVFRNPVVPGFHADPSICRVGDDYYLVNSSFEYFPGVPVFHSKDLIHWKQIGHVLTRKSQLKLDHARASAGIYAPTLRYHNGLFYMVTTLVGGGGNFYVTAKNPAGPWSDPIWLDNAGMDPSLMFDDDGSVYYTRHVGNGDGYIGQQKLDLKSGLQGEMKEVWRGTGGVWAEGPHLYKIKGKYYVMIAEGGTSYEHRITIARSDSPWGPFESNPNNPILTHMNHPDNPFQALGHGDLVETPTGWWVVFLGIRPQAGKFHHIGRETFLAPVTWKDGWPVINENKAIAVTMPAPKLPQHPWPQAPARDEFTGSKLGVQWEYVRNPYEENYSLTERKGFLRLKGTAVTMSNVDSPTFAAQRQSDFSARMSTKLSFNPKQEGEEAGLVLRGNDANHIEIGVTLRDGKRQVFLRKVLKRKEAEPVSYIDAGKGDLILTVKATPTSYEFFYRTAAGKDKSLGTAPTRVLSTEEVGGFTGVYAGPYATGNGKASTSPADFDWFEYVPGK